MPGDTPAVRSSRYAVLLVALGGAVGSVLRALIAFWVPRTDPAAFPLNTLIVNLLGCFLMGALVWCVLKVWPSRAWLRPLLGAGVLGGFTTFSAFAGEVVLLANAGSWVPAVAYVAVTLIGGVLLVRLGGVVGAHVFGDRVSP